MKMRELFSDASKWCQGWFAKTIGGVLCSEFSEKAVCWCLSGAIWKCYPGLDSDDVRRKIVDTIHTDIPYWNDAKERTFEDVKALVEKLDI